MKTQTIPIETTFQITIDDFEEIPEESTNTEDITISINAPELDLVEPMILYGCCCNTNCCGCCY